MNAILPPEYKTNPAVAARLLETLKAAKRARSKRNEWATPGELAKALDPTTVQTPALDLIDAALVKVANGEITRLIISMPPQEGKSSRTSHYGALWLMHRNPDLRLALVSYGDEIARGFSYQIRNDIQTFNGENGNLDLDLAIRADSKGVARWQLRHPAQGGLWAVGIGGSLTSKAVDMLIIDDPVKDFRAADSLVQSDAVWEWWQSVARPRLAPNAPVILILTRWHELDLAGRLLAQQNEDDDGLEPRDHWTVINIPAQADHRPELGEADPLGREPGEFMLSARGRTPVQWAATKAVTSSRIWNAIYQGKPSPDSGDVWKRQWWRRYTTMMWTQDITPGAFRVECDEMIQSWDLAFKDTRNADFVVGQVWARRGADVYLLDQIRRRLTFTDSVAALTAMHERWPQARAILVEDKANGTAVIDTLKSRIPGIIPVSPHESKYARANAVSPFIEAGNVWLPASTIAMFDPEELIDEAAGFPNSAHDDMVDATSQALARMFIDGGSASAWIAAAKAEIAARNTIEPVDVMPGVDALAVVRHAQFRQQRP